MINGSKARCFGRVQQRYADAHQIRVGFTPNLQVRGAEADIPVKYNRKVHIPHDEETYKGLHFSENCSSEIKEFRCVNTRYDKTDTNYEAT